MILNKTVILIRIMKEFIVCLILNIIVDKETLHPTEISQDTYNSCHMLLFPLPCRLSMQIIAQIILIEKFQKVHQTHGN